MGPDAAACCNVVASPQNPSPTAKPAIYRQSPEVGAVCPDRARTDLCAGYPGNGHPYRDRPRMSASIGARVREGFQQLIASVALGEVGIVLSREPWRLSTDKDRA